MSESKQPARQIDDLPVEAEQAEEVKGGGDTAEGRSDPYKNFRKDPYKN